jgi:hypothetical protein
MMQRAVVAAAAVFLCACGHGTSAPDSGPQSQDWPAPVVPGSEVPETGVRREMVQVAGFTPPANPITNGKGPAALDATVVYRYRIDSTPATPVRAVVIAVPGFLAGAGALDTLARALVRRGAAKSQPIEVWAIDRRANLLEDRRGFAAAALAGNPEIATGYYFGSDTVGRKAFAGFLQQTDVDYESEWGLAVHVEDLHRVIQKVPQDQRKARVFLLGHSLGSIFAEAYGAWRFDDGTRGFDELAGFVFLDGALGAQPISAATYQNGQTTTALPLAGLDEIRRSTRYSALPLLGLRSFARSEILAQRNVVAPDVVVADADRDQTFTFLLGLTTVPKLTNKAAMGFSFDRQFAGLTFIDATLGAVTGGAVGKYQSTLFSRQLLHPTDSTATYGWDDSSTATPPPLSNLDAFSRAYSSASGNFLEYYFPARLSLDLAAVGGANLSTSSWQAQAGLRSFDGPANDAPGLAVAGGLASMDEMTAIGARLAPTVGAGRPSAGAQRNAAAGFQVVDATNLAHVDVVTGSEDARNPVHAAVEEFVRANAAAGTVAPPSF